MKLIDHFAGIALAATLRGNEDRMTEQGFQQSATRQGYLMAEAMMKARFGRCAELAGQEERGLYEVE